MARTANRFNKAETLVLPVCGETVLVRRLDPIELQFHGVNMDRMQQAGARLIAAATTPDGEPSEADLAAIRRTIDTVTRLCLVDPVAVDTPEAVTDEDHQVWIGDLLAMDKMAIVAWVGGGEVAEQAASFPDPAGGEDADVEPLPDSQDARPAAQRPARRAPAAAAVAGGL